MTEIRGARTVRLPASKLPFFRCAVLIAYRYCLVNAPSGDAMRRSHVRRPQSDRRRAWKQRSRSGRGAGEDRCRTAEKSHMTLQCHVLQWPCVTPQLVCNRSAAELVWHAACAWSCSPLPCRQHAAPAERGPSSNRARAR